MSIDKFSNYKETWFCKINRNRDTTGKRQDMKDFKNEECMKMYFLHLDGDDTADEDNGISEVR